MSTETGANPAGLVGPCERGIGMFKTWYVRTYVYAVLKAEYVYTKQIAPVR